MNDAGLTINGTQFTLDASLSDIRSALHSDVTYLEIWLTKKDGCVLSALVNAHSGFLVWMTPDCPEGWHTCASDYPYDDPGELEFRLANGQVDRFTEDLCIPRKAVLKAFGEFWESGHRSPSISWI